MNQKTKRIEIKNDIESEELPAGSFSSWLHRIRSAETQGADVPCGSCQACCTSSYFIHITPEETQTLTQIPQELLFPAPGMPKGNMVLGYDEKGHCPMFRNEQCSIYEHRPRTCRSYDCRIFPAAGITEIDDDKPLITQRIKSWKFDYETTQDHNLHIAVKTAAVFLREHAASLPSKVMPNNAAQLAILALKVCDVFIKYADEFGKIEELPLDTDLIKEIIAAIEKFDMQ
jgi:Fe-S-cluster containining protein